MLPVAVVGPFDGFAIHFCISGFVDDVTFSLDGLYAVAYLGFHKGHAPFPSPISPLLRSRVLNPVRGLGECCKLPQRVRAEPGY